MPSATWWEWIENPGYWDVRTNYGSWMGLATEHCDISWTESQQNAWRNADTEVKLATGGPLGSARQNLWMISAGATAFFDLWGISNAPVDPTSITVLGQTLDSNGVAYVVLPDNTTEDITPKVSGVDSYTFSVGAQKYLSHFTVYVDMPDPPPGHHKHIGGNWGHAWWSLSTEAPLAAMAEVLRPYVNTSAGYYPTTDPTLLNGYDVPGVLDVPDSGHDATVSKTFDIEWNNLIGGVNYTRALHDTPGDYNALSHNCVHATRSAGAAAGVSLSADRTAEGFGWDLINSQ